MALPLLPGLSLRRNIGGENFHKSQHWGFCNNVPMLFEEKPGIGGQPLLDQRPKPKYSEFPEGMGSNPPAWIAFDKQVLNFDAYFKEEVPDKNQELYRIRHCKIYFYLEDDTIQVTEPHVLNSGIDQGTILRRHRIRLPPPHEDQFYTVHHFNINIDVNFYSRIFKIVDCDLYTKNFLKKMGIRVNPPGTRPADPYITERQQMALDLTLVGQLAHDMQLVVTDPAWSSESSKYSFVCCVQLNALTEQTAAGLSSKNVSTNPLHPYERFDTLKQFLEYDGQVLGFSCVWNDSECQYYGPRELVLRYYLSDDTIDIREVLPENSGRDVVPLFLKRDKLPKDAPTEMYQPGTITNYTLLNVLGRSGRNKGWYIRDPLQTGAVHQEFYKDCDLKIGAVINVWGRKMVICDCDEFTKEYYRKKYGIEDFTPVQYKAPPPPKPEKPIPPYTGFGSEEDSLCSCKSLLPKAPHKDFRKFLEKDRYGMESNTLRFGAKFITDSPIDKDRKFIISYFLGNDTISVFEYTERNTGIPGGRFLERGRIKKPGQELFKSEPSEYYKAHDLFVGARVCFHGHSFLLVDADEYTFSYMEKNANEFPVADIGVILMKLKDKTESRSKEIRKTFATTDPEHTNVVDYDTFSSASPSIWNARLISSIVLLFVFAVVLLQAGSSFDWISECCHSINNDIQNWIVSVAGGAFSEHEIMTLGRHYGVRDDSQIDLTFLLAVAHEKLKKNSFENFDQLSAVFIYNDREKCGVLPYDTCRTICKSFRLPLSDELLENLLTKYEDDHKLVNYKMFVNELNWRENQIRPVPTVKGRRKGRDSDPVRSSTHVLGNGQTSQIGVWGVSISSDCWTRVYHLAAAAFLTFTPTRVFGP
ncbi:EF-hand domain-containing family member C2 [Willisornis vidua]|uniref:EF-hand domain-containing family member C2 n=1 Tax=Willisornis vidua TaxID=1566151 RepID=A0ABQ9DI35_9PASS|nr:EF-hand domain-containing family member C2 [Willisornis vidua]